MRRQTLLALIFALFTSISLLPSATHAFDAESVIKSYQAHAKQNDIIFTYREIEQIDERTISIKSVDSFDKKTEQRVNIDTIDLDGVREGANGHLQFESMTISGYQQKGKAKNGDDFDLKVETVVANGLGFSDLGEQAKDFWPSQIGRADLTNLSIESQSGKNKVDYQLPKATVENLVRTNLRNFLVGSIEIAPSTGRVQGGGDDVDFAIGSISVGDSEYFGTQGFEIGFLNSGELEMNFVNKEKDEIDLVFDGLSLKNLYSPDPEVKDKPLFSQKDLTAEIKPLSVLVNGKQFAGWKRGFGSSRYDAETSTITSEGRFEEIAFDFTLLPPSKNNVKTMDDLTKLGLEKMVLNLDANGSWNTETGVLDVSQYRIELEDGGTFFMSARVAGYTEEVARQFTTALNKMNSETDREKQNALSLQAMAQLAALSIQRLEIRAEDQSLLDRVIAVQAAKLKQEPDQIRGIVGPMVNVAMMPYNVPELAAQTSGALGTFMQGNKTLTILAEPKNGLAITEIIALSSGVRAGTIKPAEFVERLNLTVIAE